MITRVISGGQTGVDQAALRAARRAGLATGGWAPRGWQTEAGPAPWLADFGLAECGGGYARRTRANVDIAVVTLIVIAAGEDLRGGTGLTLSYCEEQARENCKPFALLDLSHKNALSVGLTALELHFRHGDGDLNVAGPRESRRPGVGAQAEAFLATLFGQFGLPVAPPDVT